MTLVLLEPVASKSFLKSPAIAQRT